MKHAASRTAKRKKQQISSKFGEVSEHVRARALDQARRVSWRRLADTVDEANRWEVFTLWLRAVVDAAKSIPPVVEREIERRMPGFLVRVEDDMRAAFKQDGPGHRLWNLVGSWTAANVFVEPKMQGWLDAVHYFSSMSLPYMKAWAHWERVNKEWRTNPPAEWPTHEQWQADVAAVTLLANPDSVPQQVLDAVRSVSVSEWERLLCAFFDLIAFSMWLELTLDLEGPASQVASEGIGARYPGFSFSGSELASGAAVRELNSWVTERVLRLKEQSLLAALSWHVRHHPAYHAMRNYAVHCHHTWLDNCPSRLPSFQDWRRSADEFTY